MTDLSAAAISKLIGKILDDIYELGKSSFATHLERLKRETVRKNLVKRAALCEKVKTIWQLDKEVRIPDFYYPSRIRFNPEVTKVVGSLKHFPPKGNFVIEGTIGQGKSIFLRYLCAEELRGKGTGKIPIFVELRLVEKAAGLQGAITNTLDEYGFAVTEDLLDFYSRSGKFVLLLDAFDELPPDCVSGVIAELERLSSKYPDLQIFVTSRPDSEIHRSRHFRTFKLAALSQEDHKPFLKKLLLAESDVKQLLQAIVASPTRVASLLTTPLMLTLVAVVYRAEKAIPPELPQFFEMLFSTLFSRHDRTKAGFIRARHADLTERATQELFEAFCFMTRYHEMSTSLTDQEIDRALQGAIKYSGVKCEADAFYKDITKIACLMQREGLKTNFIHKSIQEFFAASFVRRANDSFARKFYESQRGAKGRMWVQENAFLMQIDPYRFARHFYMPEISEIEKFYEIDFSKGVPKADDRLVQIMTDGSEVVVEIEDEGELNTRSFPLNLPENAGPLLRSLAANAAFVVYRFVDGSVDETKATILGSLAKVGDEYVAPAKEFMDEHDLVSELVEEMNDDLGMLKRRYDYLRYVISLEESKASLFE